MYKHLDVDDLVLEEFKAGRTEIDAFVSVFTKLKMALYDTSTPSRQTIQKWFLTFHSGDYFVCHEFHFRELLIEVACNYQKLKSALFLSANKQKLGGSLILNGRYGLFFDKGTLNEDEFIVTDYFNGENRHIPILNGPLKHDYPSNNLIFRQISHSLIVAISIGHLSLSMTLLKWDTQQWTLTIQDLYTLLEDRGDCQVVFDQERKTEFVLVQKYRVYRGRVKEGKIQVDKEPANFDEATAPPFGDFLNFCKLSNGILYGFRIAFSPESHYRFYDFCEKSLDSRNIPMKMHHRLEAAPEAGLISRLMTNYKWVWHKNRLYFCLSSESSMWNGRSFFHLYCFDADLGQFVSTGIYGHGRLATFYADDNDVLTLMASEVDEKWEERKRVVYRVPTSQPDTLQTLCWLAIRRQHIFFDDHIYNRTLTQLPLNYEFQAFGSFKLNK